MLDYSTIEVVNPNMGLDPTSIFFIFLALMTGFFTALNIADREDSMIKGLCSGVLIILLIFVIGGCSGIIKNSALVKIEATGIEMKSEVFPSENEYPYLKKEGENIYYYTKVWQEDIKSPSKVRDRTFKKFKEVKFDLENQIKE